MTDREDNVIEYDWKSHTLAFGYLLAGHSCQHGDSDLDSNSNSNSNSDSDSDACCAAGDLGILVARCCIAQEEYCEGESCFFSRDASQVLEVLPLPNDNDNEKVRILTGKRVSEQLHRSLTVGHLHPVLGFPKPRAAQSRCRSCLMDMLVL